VAFPVWEIANELVVARYLERVLGWQYVRHEPPGRHDHRGDWEFTSASRQVFVEVKSLRELMYLGNGGVYSRPDYRPRIRSALVRAYEQLPADGPATLVVLVGNDLLKLPGGHLAHGDLFQALFGKTIITLKVLPFDPESVRVGPSFREMWVQGTKHRRLGCVAGLILSGMELPRPNFYAIHNPFAHTPVRLTQLDVEPATQFVVDEAGLGTVIEGIHPTEAWARMR
jgi:hypothetical protein